MFRRSALTIIVVALLCTSKAAPRNPSCRTVPSAILSCGLRSCSGPEIIFFIALRLCELLTVLPPWSAAGSRVSALFLSVMVANRDCRYGRGQANGRHIYDSAFLRCALHAADGIVLATIEAAEVCWYRLPIFTCSFKKRISCTARTLRAPGPIRSNFSRALT